MRRPSLHHVLIMVIGACWTVAVAYGASVLWKYDGTPGVPARPPLARPVALPDNGKRALPTLVLLIHPQCPCSRATLDELARLMADCNGKLMATVLMVRPERVSEGWEKTDLWRQAAGIPGVAVRADDRGEECRRFGASTSGQAILYSPEGQLLFSGGITESRGHRGDNAGRSAITALVLHSGRGPGGRALETPVYGCPLLDESSLCAKE